MTFKCIYCGHGAYFKDGDTYVCSRCGKRQTLEEINKDMMSIKVSMPKPKRELEALPKGLSVTPVIVKPLDKPKLSENIADKKLEVKLIKPKETAPAKPFKVEPPKIKKNTTKKIDAPKPDNERLLDNLLVLMMDAVEAKKYENAIALADKIIAIDSNYTDAYLMKAAMLIDGSKTLLDGLVKTIPLYEKAFSIVNQEALVIKISDKLIDKITDDIIKTLKQDTNLELHRLKEQINIYSKFINVAKEKIGFDEKMYFKRLSNKINNELYQIFIRSYHEYNLEPTRQTDERYMLFKARLDSCIDIWEYLVDLSRDYSEVDRILENISGANRAIIRLSGHRLSGKKLVVSMHTSKDEERLRILRFDKLLSKIENTLLRHVDRSIKFNTLDYNELVIERNRLIDKKANLEENKRIEELKNDNIRLINKTNSKNKEENEQKIVSNRLQIITERMNLYKKEKTIDSELYSLNELIMLAKLQDNYYKII